MRNENTDTYVYNTAIETKLEETYFRNETKKIAAKNL